MKTILFTTLLLILNFNMAQAQTCDLSSATSQELMGELDRRLMSQAPEDYNEIKLRVVCDGSTLRFTTEYMANGNLKESSLNITMAAMNLCSAKSLFFNKYFKESFPANTMMAICAEGNLLTKFKTDRYGALVVMSESAFQETSRCEALANDVLRDLVE